jgi:predicted DNA-binding transcriptional regulator AlpA
MNTYQFTLRVAGVDEDNLDAVLEATDGSAAAEFGSPWGNRVEFEWEGDGFAGAVLDAIGRVHSVPGLLVLRVEPDQLVWAAEIAQRTGRSRQSIDLLVKGRRGNGDFPTPIAGSNRNPLWRWLEVEEWFAKHEGREPDLDTALVIGAINGALEARRNLRQRDDPKLSKQLKELLAS